MNSFSILSLVYSAFFLVSSTLMVPGGSTGSEFTYTADSPYEKAVYVTDIFTDVSSEDWFAQPVQNAYSHGLMRGISESCFAPLDNMSRAMFVQTMYTMAGKPPLSADAAAPSFEDVSSFDWYYNAVCWAFSNGIASGLSETCFGVNEPITREQAAVLLYNKNVPASEADSAENTLSETFADAASIDPWAVNAMVWAVDTGIFSGSLNEEIRTLDPLVPASRCEAAALFTSLYNRLNPNAADITLPAAINVDASVIRKGTRVPVLMYHEILEKPWGLEYLFVTPDTMRQQLQLLKNNGNTTIFFSDLNDLSAISKPVILTLDDGYVGNYTELFPLLKEFNAKATIFVATDMIGTDKYLTAKQIKEMSDSGLVQIQSHTRTHSKLNELSEEQLINECQASKNVISNITGISPYVISYPEGQYSALSNAVISQYFAFGVRDRGGVWKYDGDLYSVRRSTVSRDMTLKEFQERL